MTTDPGVAESRAIGREYLRHIARLGIKPDDLRQHAVNSDALAVSYQGRLLATPAFLGAAERRRLPQDLLAVHGLLCDLPDRLFDGSRTRLGRAVGLSELQCAHVSRVPGGRPPPLGRSDLHRSPTGFKLLELNISTALGGFENAHINRAMLAHPALREFVEEHRLEFTDTFQRIVDTMRRAVDLAEDSLVAVVDWPQSFVVSGPRLQLMAQLLSEQGIDSVACDIGQLTEHDGGLRFQGRPVDVVFRRFLLEDIRTEQDRRLIEPVLAAEERGRVAVFARLDTELYGSKGALALLSEGDAAAFSADERALVQRFVPWTRFVRPSTTDPGADRVDLLRYATSRREELLLKPTLLHGGEGIVPGWLVGDAEWESRLNAAMNGPYVLQERVRPSAEAVPGAEPGQVDETYLLWGAFYADPGATNSDGYAGCFLRSTDSPDVGAVTMGSSVLMGCCFHAEHTETAHE